MTRARILKSRMTRKCHVRFGSGGGVGDRPAHHNLGFTGTQDQVISSSPANRKMRRRTSAPTHIPASTSRST